MTQPILLVGFFAVLGAFGYTVSRTLLKWENALAIAGATSVFGPTAYIVAVNTLGYVLPIQAVFWLVLGIFAGAALLLHIKNGEAEPLSLPPQRITWAFAALVGLVGFAYARYAGSDAWTLGHFPIPATIMEGNFPVAYATNPFERISYHYGHALLIAGISSVTNVSLATSYVLQSWINVAGIVLFAGAIAQRYTRSWNGALLCGTLALAGAGLFWLNGIWLSKDLIEHFVLGNPVDPPNETAFRWLTYVIHNAYGNGLLMSLGHKPIATGAAISFALLSVLMEMFLDPARGKHVAWIITAIVLGAALALTLETTLVVFVAAAAATVILAAMHRQDWTVALRVLLLVFIPTMAIAFVQGGVFGNSSGETGASSFLFGFDGRIHYHAGVEKWTVALWEWKFFRDFGIHLALVAAAYAFFLRKRRMDSLLLFLFAVVAGHFLTPLFVQFTPRVHEMNRLFFVFFGISSLVAGMYLWESRLRFRSVLIALMLIAGTLNAGVRLAFPTLNVERTPLFPTMPPVTAAEKAAYRWVKDHTDIEDIFFLHSGSDTEERWKNRTSFIAHTGRFSIGMGFEDPKPVFKADMGMIEERCDTDLMHAYDIRYFLAQTAERAEWFAGQCDPDAWELRYDGGIEGNAYPRVYRLVESPR